MVTGRACDRCQLMGEPLRLGKVNQETTPTVNGSVRTVTRLRHGEPKDREFDARNWNGFVASKAPVKPSHHPTRWAGGRGVKMHPRLHLVLISRKCGAVNSTPICFMTWYSENNVTRFTAFHHSKSAISNGGKFKHGENLGWGDAFRCF